jgi:hypothetical protein
MVALIASARSLASTQWFNPTETNSPMKRVVLIVAASLALQGCTRVQEQPAPAPAPVENRGLIGGATMRDDGTIVLDLRLQSGEMVGHALATYPKDHPDYARVLKHLGGLRPGEEKPVPPFPANWK